MSNLDENYAFANFNFTAVWQPTISPGPREDQLIELVYRARCGDTNALCELADTMYCTLCRETYDAYQHIHRPVDVSYRMWFYEKLFEFLRLLLFEGVSATRCQDDGKFERRNAYLPLEEGFHIINYWGEEVEIEDIERAFRPEDNDCSMWFELAKAVSEVADNRLQVLQSWLRDHGRASPSREGQRKRWSKNQKRDSIIANGLRRGLDKIAICQELDANRIPLLRALALVDLGLESWVAGWADAKGRNAIQQLFSKSRTKS